MILTKPFVNLKRPIYLFLYYPSIDVPKVQSPQNLTIPQISAKPNTPDSTCLHHKSYKQASNSLPLNPNSLSMIYLTYLTPYINYFFTESDYAIVTKICRSK